MFDPVRAQAEVPYPTGLYLPGHPDFLAACARVHGLDPAPANRCRYLDLGCGDGTNLLAVAESMPEAECLGIDIAPSAIEIGQDLQSRSGIENATLLASGFEDATVPEGQWDYVVMHGILSWIPGVARRQAFDLAARALAPNGVLMASYNALPGWSLLGPARSLARRQAAHARGQDAQAIAERSRAAIRRVLEIGVADRAYLEAMKEALMRYEEANDQVLIHDDLADLADPLGLEHAAALAAEAGLGYAGEALPDHWWRHRLDSAAVQTIVTSSGDSAVDRQIEADSVLGVVFKATMFAREAPDRPTGPDWRNALDLHLMPLVEPGTEPRPDDPALLRRTAEILSEVPPTGISVAELADRAGVDREPAAQAALVHCAQARAWPLAAPPRFVYPAPERPLVPALNRLIAQRTGDLQTLSWDSLELRSEIGQALVSLLDGTRTREDIAAELKRREDELGISGIPDDRLASAVEARLEEMAQVGALVPPPASG